jgi:hypothetical protein
MPITRTPYFSPLQISGCKLWLDAADLTTMFQDTAGTNPVTATGQSVALWKDKSSGAYNYTKGSTAPILSSAGGVYFGPGSGAIMSNGDTWGSFASYDLFCVVKPNPNAGAWRTLFTGGSSGENLVIILTGTTQLGSALFTNFYQFGSLTADGSTNFILHVKFDASRYITAAINGNTTFTSAIGPAAANTQPWYMLGNNSGSQQWGYINEITIVPNTTTYQRQQLEAYLAQKWGLTSSLPQDHLGRAAILYRGVKMGVTNLPVYTQFTPLQISGCSLWLDAADPAGTGTPPSNNTSVTTWVDKSTKQANFNGSATYILDTVYNKYGLSFNGTTNYFVSSTNRITNTTYTIFTVHRFYNDVVSVGNVYRATSDKYWFRQQGSTVNWITDLDPSGYVNISGTAAQLSGISCINTFTSTTARAYLNGTIIGSSARSTSTNVAFVIGANAGPAEFLQGAVFEMLIYNTSLTLSQQQQIESYLAQKWGLTAILPTFSGPTAISGCSLWLDAADPAGTGVLPSNGTTVATWVDKSGNGKHGTSIGNAGSTTWTTNGLNGYPTIAFDGATGSYAGTITTNSGNTLSMFVVAYILQGTSVNNYPRLISLAPSGSQDYAITGGTFLGRNVLAANPQSIMTYRSTSILSSQPITYGTPFIGCSVFTGSSNTTYANGTTGGAGGSSGNFSYNTYNIGRIAGGVGFNTDSTLLGSVSEIIVYSTALTDLQRQQIEGYLAWKWGLQTSLPTTHSYYGISATHIQFIQPTGLPTVNTKFIKGIQLRFNSPLTISGCKLWIDAADATTVTFTSGTVSAIRDKSGLSNNLGEGVGFTYPNNTFNGGKPSFYYSGSTNGTNLGINRTLNIASPWTFVWVAQRTAAPGPAYSWMDTLTNDSNRVYAWDPFNPNRWASRSYFSSTDLRGPAATPSICITEFGLSPYLMVNGATMLSNENTPVNTNSTGFIFGNYYGYASGAGANGHIAEMICYNRSITSQETADLNTYLKAKWGISF